MGHDEKYETPRIPLFTAVMTFLGYTILLIFGHLRDLFRKTFFKGQVSKNYAPLVEDFADFYTRRMYKRLHDAFARPVRGCPGAYIDVMKRIRPGYLKPLIETNEWVRCLNLGSYNYLGFGDPDSPTKPEVFAALEKYSSSTCSARSMVGTLSIHREAEKLVAEYVGKEDAIIFGMGFATNHFGIPGIVGPGCLIVSDANNHSSIVHGCRGSGALINSFKHNDPEDLEATLRRWIVRGQPVTHRPWKKILVIVEGIYSMEGEMCPLDKIVAICKKYKAYLFVDEAHSIGAIGKTGRGICEQKGVKHADVDVLMGTFTKSFGSVGGYIAGSKELIAYIRHNTANSMYSISISPPACQQIISSLNIMMGRDGTDLGKRKLQQLRDNANYCRARFREMGCHVLGEEDSPVVPLMLYNPAKISAFSRECFARGMAVVVVSFPATPILLSRSRMCISAAHTREDLDTAIAKIEEVADLLGLKYSKGLAAALSVDADNASKKIQELMSNPSSFFKLRNILDLLYLFRYFILVGLAASALNNRTAVASMLSKVTGLLH